MDFVRRTVWDGDHELWEIQMPDDANRENDTGDLPDVEWQLEGGGYVDPNAYWGRVAYTHGAAIDQPLSVTRFGYADEVRTPTGVRKPFRRLAAFSILPLWDYRGRPVLGTYGRGQLFLCDPNDSQWCVWNTWPELWFAYYRDQVGRVSWHGELLEDKKDHAGTFFRRNRYYDPVTGKFTQEDPIGLAGGLNVYGFAAGDPVSYGDPYGLKVCFRGTAGEVEALRLATEEAVSAEVTLDSNNCISEVGAARNRSLAALRNRLALLAGVDDRYEVRFEKGPGEREEDILAGTGQIRQSWSLNPRNCPANVCPRRVQIGSGWRVPYRSTRIMGFCAWRGSTPPTLAHVVVHELLGHGFENYAYGPAANSLSEMFTIRHADHIFEAAVGLPQRCGH